MILNIKDITKEEENRIKHWNKFPAMVIRDELKARFIKGQEEFTPADMLHYLEYTNQAANINTMLNLIPEGKEAEFKEAVCTAVAGRIMAPINIKKTNEIAQRGNFVDELNIANEIDKVVPSTAWKYSVFEAKSNADLQANPDLTKYNMVVCDFKGKTEFADLDKLPKKMIIKGDIDLDWMGLEELPDLSNVIVKGNFDCGNNYITSLKGAPKEVGGDFDCSHCWNLTSLKGAPKEVGGDFNCFGCKNITSLKGAPKIVGGKFDCIWCENLTSLEGAPEKVGGNFDCGWCKNLTSLKGAPKYVGGNFDCSKCNNLKTLEGAPKYIGSDFDCEGCISLTSLKGVREKVGRDFICTECKNLKSLEGAPEKVGGSFVCDCCVNLKSFVGGPKYVEGNFRYTSHVIRYHREFKHETKLSSFEVMPEYIGGDLSISGCGKKYLA